MRELRVLLTLTVADEVDDEDMAFQIMRYLDADEINGFSFDIVSVDGVEVIHPEAVVFVP